MSFLQMFLSLLLSSDLLLLSSANSITLSLSRVAPQTTNPLENLKYHAAASLARAQHLTKYPNEPYLPLYPRSYGEYIVNLSFGTPPQTLRFTMDTGSSLVWSPCTNHYNCTHCDYPAGVTFIPESSASYKNVTCQSPQCKWLDADPQCNDHNKCGYIYEYGQGSTTGRLLSETLTFPGLSVDNFIVGCSVSASYEPEGGVAGFGRARISLPSQLGLTSFSYCMVSHDLDDNTTASSDLVLNTTRDGGKARAGEFNYTPFVSDSDYYVSLESISIGGVHVNVSAKYLLPDANGNGGTVVDSGSTYTMMEQSTFDSVLKELDKQVGQIYKREKQIENETGFDACYNVKNNYTSLPQFTFHFQGNTEMVLPLANYFSYADVDESVVCMTIINHGEVQRGPAIILGNHLQQDFYMEYDLENNRLGILPQEC